MKYIGPLGHKAHVAHIHTPSASLLATASYLPTPWAP